MNVDGGKLSEIGRAQQFLIGGVVRNAMADWDYGPYRRIPRTDLSKYWVGPGIIRYRCKCSFSPSLDIDERYRSARMDIIDMDRGLGEIVLSEGDYIKSLGDAYSANIAHTLNDDGTAADLEEVRSLVNLLHEGSVTERRDLSAPQREMLNYIRTFISLSRGGRVPRDVDEVISLHGRLMEGVLPENELGGLRKETYVILDDCGRPRIVTCPPEHIRSELTSLLKWVDRSPYDPIATAVIFFVEFVGIRPFIHGNNRAGSTLAQLIMHTMGLREISFTKYEVWVYDNYVRFQNLLAYCMREQDYWPLVIHICESIHDAYSEAIGRISSRNLLSDADAHMRIIAQRAKYLSSEFTVADCCRWIPDVKEQTVRSKLNALVSCGVLRRRGNTRNTRYRFIEPFADVTEPVRSRGGPLGPSSS